MKRNYTACPEPSSGQGLVFMSQTHDSVACVFPIQKPIAPLLCLVSFPGLQPAWVCGPCQGFGSLPVPPFLPLPKASGLKCQQLPPSPYTLEGNMLFP